MAAGQAVDLLQPSLATKLHRLSAMHAEQIISDLLESIVSRAIPLSWETRSIFIPSPMKVSRHIPGELPAPIAQVRAKSHT